MKHKRTLLILAGNLLAILILLNEVKAQDRSGFIYGKVKTLDNSYEGQIRWNDEEAFWNDHFNATKVKNATLQEYREKLKKEPSSGWGDFDWDIKSIWSDKVVVVHQFVCEFGDIKSIAIQGRSKILLELKNGEKMLLDGSGSNDVGSDVVVYDKELGEIAIDWDRIIRIDFMQTPKNLKVSTGPPIYGTVETFRKGTFKGLIQWDHDERLGDEKLDGDNKDGDVSIPFKSIQYIEKSGDGSKVILFSGRDFFLTRSNDVNSENRGIYVTTPELGRVDIPWRYFQSLTLEENPDSGPAYDTYKIPRGLNGKVYVDNNESYSGRILFDIDEEWEIEMLEGKDDGVGYMIPFKNIKAIIPKNYNYSMVELRNGQRILLGDQRDVSDDNDGILIFPRDANQPDYVAWDDVVEIIFD